MAQVDSENSTIAPEIAVTQLRKEAADQIERLIAFLDETDDDPDLEAYLTGYSDTGNDDREGDGADNEPSLGSFETIWNQSAAWSTDGKACADTDLEHDDCDDEDGHDAEDDRADQEPSLGWPQNIAQGISHGGTDDRELQTHTGMSDRKATQLRSHIPGFSNLRSLLGGRVVL